ncbi:ABC transporter permease [Gayadomonas joobiniege]|uniref:ABC transporter permease n=1 Tax=Gayadomonas joobiniege TaxID=1234606 RepID=UPI00036E2801|nr:FtsX-like permease family protein [Gayadomonas joobiniege]
MSADFSFAIKLSQRLLRHELRRGELTIILLAMILAVSAVFSLSMFSERLQAALQEKSAEFLAADAVVSSSRPIENQWLEYAQETGLQTSEQIRFASMIFANDKMLLASLRAVDSKYPLRGEIEVTTGPWQPGKTTQNRVSSGEVWLDSELISQLGVSPGQLVEIGQIELEVKQIIASVPDADLNVFNSGALALMNLADVEAAGLIRPGSRINYLLSVAGEQDKVTEFQDWLLPQLNRDVHRWRSLDNDESRIMRSVKRAEKYFLLASLLGVILASVAIAVAASRYCQRHFDLVAILKTQGASAKQIRWVFIIQLLGIYLLGSLIGLTLGYLGQQAVLSLFAERLPGTLPSASLRPYWLALMTGSISLIMFSAFPVFKLFNVPPLRVLRRQLEGYNGKDWINWLLSATAVFLLMWLYSKNLELSLALLVSAGGVTAILLVLARSAIWGSRQAGARASSAFKLAIAGLYRRASANSIQLISFTIAIELLLVVLVLRNDLLSEWQSQLPEDTPNYFALNISEFELSDFKSSFSAKGIEVAETYPVTRGRLLKVNDLVLRDEVSKDKSRDPNRDRPRAIGRELSLTSSAERPKHNKIAEGEWWRVDSQVPQVSVETGVAERVGIKLGDKLTFNAGGREFTAEVTSMREVKWESMQPNFYMIFNPLVLEDFAATHIASFYVPEATKPELGALMTQFPSVTLIDIDALIVQLTGIIDQVSVAVEFILLLVIGAGALVLVAQVQSSLSSRRQELVILRTLGANGRLLKQSIFLEFVILGALAGFFAALANEVALLILQTQVFNMQAGFHPQYWLLGIITGAVLVGCMGYLSCRRLTQMNTQQLLRQSA